jgi:hypothetical protein
MFHWQYYLAAVVIRAQSLHSHICVNTHIFYNIEMLVRQKKFKKNGTAVNAVFQGNLSTSIGSPAMV